MRDSEIERYRVFDPKDAMSHERKIVKKSKNRFLIHRRKKKELKNPSKLGRKEIESEKIRPSDSVGQSAIERDS